MDGVKEKMKDNIIWAVLGIIVSYIFLTSGSELAENIKFIISSNLLLVLIVIIMGVIIYKK